MPATMPPKMMIETPLPMPSSVMIWPSHMASIVPAVSVKTIEPPSPAGTGRNPNSVSTGSPLPALASSDDWPNACSAASGMVRIVRILVQLVPAGLAFLAERLQLRDDRHQQLDDDGGRDVRVHAHRHHREVLQRATRQQVQQTEQLIRLRRCCASAARSTPGTGMCEASR